jgi:hypothetical protein
MAIKWHFGLAKTTLNQVPPWQDDEGERLKKREKRRQCNNAYLRC